MSHLQSKQNAKICIRNASLKTSFLDFKVTENGGIKTDLYIMVVM